MDQARYAVSSNNLYMLCTTKTARPVDDGDKSFCNWQWLGVVGMVYVLAKYQICEFCGVSTSRCDGKHG